MYQQEGPINTVSNVGPLEVVQGLQRLSDKTPSMVLDSWNSLTQQEKLEIENPSSDWLNSVKKAKKDLNHIDIVSLITRSGGHFSMIMTLFDFFQVRRHLISATAKDFSLIIAFTDLSDCKMQLVDLDCKVMHLILNPLYIYFYLSQPVSCLSMFKKKLFGITPLETTPPCVH